MSRKISRIVIHTSDTPDDRNIGAEEITQWHQANGWKTIGYHWVVRRNGHLELGRPMSVVGAHVAGHNSDSIGICWIGRYNPTEPQIEAMLQLTRNLMFAFNIDKQNVLGHKELFEGKTCPNIDMDVFRKCL